MREISFIVLISPWVLDLKQSTSRLWGNCVWLNGKLYNKVIMAFYCTLAKIRA